MTLQNELNHLHLTKFFDKWNKGQPLSKKDYFAIRRAIDKHYGTGEPSGVFGGGIRDAETGKPVNMLRDFAIRWLESWAGAPPMRLTKKDKRATARLWK
ncbi:MAG: hypothetical protein OK452_04290 [Thaumarchaeota archaeon]|nr:hypothetical protein [Nitrososphaerota archaeon]